MKRYAFEYVWGSEGESAYAAGPIEAPDGEWVKRSDVEAHVNQALKQQRVGWSDDYAGIESERDALRAEVERLRGLSAPLLADDTVLRLNAQLVSENARLRAALPDLLAALKEFLECNHDMHGSSTLEKMEKAVAKAEGA
jgi:hypothetical protein